VLPADERDVIPESLPEKIEKSVPVSVLVGPEATELLGRLRVCREQSDR
jgi:hypothetical protein